MRSLSTALVAAPVLLAVVGAGAACTSKNDDSLTCGDGTQLSGRTCVAVTDAGGADAAQESGSGATLTFAGIGDLVPASPTSLFAVWTDAKEGNLPADQLKYQVFLGTDAAPIDFTKPLAVTMAGATSYYLTGLDATKSYHVAVRAKDPGGTIDTNVIQKSATPALDATAPTFAGAVSAAPGDGGAVTLTWVAATDDMTPASALVYFVYVTDTLGTFDFSVPAFVTKPGATGATIPYLSSPKAVYNFIVRARDAAGNLDANAATVSSEAGKDTLPPEFNGCKTATADSAGSAVVSWDAALDDGTPAAQIAYQVYASQVAGQFDFTAPPRATTTGTGEVRVDGLTAGTTWYFTCRARDASGNTDANAVAVSAKTLADDVAPVFAGVTGATVDPVARKVVLTWAPGTDDKTAQQDLVYDVYEAELSHAQSFKAAPRASSTPGATQIEVEDLTPEAVLFWVVRARDLAGNHDSNTVEVSGARINVSFRREVEVLLERYCAVPGCHVPGNPVANLVMTPGFAYSYLVGVRSAEFPSEFRVNPGDPSTSFFWEKVSSTAPRVGWQMPAPATGSVLTAAEKQMLNTWIAQGAPNN